MLVAWMTYTILLTSLVCVAALAAERVVAIWQGGQRFVWLAAILATTAAPVALAARRVAPTPAPALRVTPASMVPRPLRVAPASAMPVSSVTQIRMSSIGRAARSGLAARATRVAAVVEPYARNAWLITSASLLTLFLAALIQVRRQESGWRATDLDGTRVLLAANAGPAVVGSLRPRVVIPRWTLSLDARAR